MAAPERSGAGNREWYRRARGPLRGDISSAGLATQRHPPGRTRFNQGLASGSGPFEPPLAPRDRCFVSRLADRARRCGAEHQYGPHQSLVLGTGPARWRFPAPGWGRFTHSVRTVAQGRCRDGPVERRLQCESKAAGSRMGTALGGRIRSRSCRSRPVFGRSQSDAGEQYDASFAPTLNEVLPRSATRGAWTRVA